MGSENAKAVAREVIATIKAGKKVRKGLIIRKHGYSKSISTVPAKITNTKSYKSVTQPIIEAMEEERRQIIEELKKKRNKAKYRDLMDGLDKITKNVELLSGRETERIGSSGIDDIYTRLYDGQRNRKTRKDS